MLQKKNGQVQGIFVIPAMGGRDRQMRGFGAYWSTRSAYLLSSRLGRDCVKRHNIKGTTAENNLWPHTYAHTRTNK